MIEAKKKYGQNFLKDANIINRIVNAIEVEENDLIIEIGPGQGALTKHLKEKKAELICFEIDERMHEVLDKLEDEKTHIIYQDILSVDIKTYIDINKYKNIYVIANLPYYITTPIIERLMTSSMPIKEMILMVQKEVAERFSASPSCKEYGLMTVLLNTCYSVQKLFLVNRNCFVPSPKVDSAVVSLKCTDLNFDIQNFIKMKKFLSICFAHKRKTLKNNLGTDNWKRLLPIIEKFNISPSDRPEDICVEAYIEMCNNI